MTLSEFVRVFKDGIGCRHITILKIESQSLLVDFSPESGVGVEGFQFAGKHESVALNIIVEWFDACTVSDNDQFVALFVQNGESKHTDKPVYTLYAPFTIGMKYDLCIGIKLKPVSQSHQFLSNLPKIVDLTIEDYRQIRKLHRLIGPL